MDIEGSEHEIISLDEEAFESVDIMIAELHGSKELVQDFILKMKNLGFLMVDSKHSSYVFKKKIENFRLRATPQQITHFFPDANPDCHPCRHAFAGP